MIGSGALTGFFLGVVDYEGFGSTTYFQLVLSGAFTPGFTIGNGAS